VVSDEWRALAVRKAKEMGSVDPEKSADLIFNAFNPYEMVEDTCFTEDCGVPPPDVGDFVHCVQFKRHMDRYDTAAEAISAWDKGEVKDFLETVYPCTKVKEETERQFLELIEEYWLLFDPAGGDLVGDLAYFKENVRKVPVKVRDKWQDEFSCLFGGGKPFAAMSETERAWFRRKLEGYMASNPRARPKAPVVPVIPNQ
jgi:hypothetical protein